MEMFSPLTQTWFSESFEVPTPSQAGAWEAISGGKNVLVVAPTGSGKTLAAFLWSIDRIANTSVPPKKERLRVLYISPLKALAVDIDRNLRSPINGISNAAVRAGRTPLEISVGVRTGDTPQDQRRRLVTTPPDILITTPESLFLMLTSSARESLRYIDTVIIDEVHALAPNKRGAHLTVSLERLDLLLERPARRIGLSATVRPVDEIAAFLGGTRPVEVVQPRYDKKFDLKVVVPVEDMSDLGEVMDEVPNGSASGPLPVKTIWPAIEQRLSELIAKHRSTIVFVNRRGLAERLSARLNELAEKEIARAHHGSVSREQRKLIEEDLKAGRLPAVVATSSLELGIDMGAVDLVVQVESPTSVASGLQRVGRAGHQVGAVSSGVIFPKFRGDLVVSAVVVESMRNGAIESMRYPRNPLDVLAQHIVAMVAMDEWEVETIAEVLRRAAPFASLPDSALESVLNMLSGLYPSDRFAELRPRINWDRLTGKLTGRPGAQRLAVTSGGTIPDRGLFGVFLSGNERARVGELDEEMVYESRVGTVFKLGSSNWRIEDITHDRVIVSPAPGENAAMPFWHGDGVGRPLELGRALGEFLREVQKIGPEKSRVKLLDRGLDELAADNLLAYLAEQKEATGYLPDDKTIVCESFRDEIGDWRLCIHSPFGAQVHAPWTLAIEARIRNVYGIEVQTMHSDDGIVIRIPESDEPPKSAWAIFDPDEIEDLVTLRVGGSSLFASRFRECASRALLLPRRGPDRRTPLWQQRQRSYNLLQATSDYGSFPILLETMRECLQDVFDLPGLKQLMQQINSREVKVVEVRTESGSPFAGSLAFSYVANFIFDGDSPLAERRAEVLTLDAGLLAELLGKAELREVIEEAALDELERELQRLSPDRRIRGIDDVHDALRAIGDLSRAELLQRGARDDWLQELEDSRRILPIKVAGHERYIAAEDAAKFRDALGSPLPPGLPDAFLAHAPGAPIDLVSRFARTHGPFHPEDVSARLGLGVAVVAQSLRALESERRVVTGEFRPGGVGLEWCDTEVLRLLKRKSLAKLRKQIEAVPRETLGKFLPAWQSVGGHAGYGPDALYRAVEQLQGRAVPASALERFVLPARVLGYSASMLDELTAAGEVIWAGSGRLGSDDGWISLYFAGEAQLLLPQVGEETELTPEHLQVTDALQSGGALFFRQLTERTGLADADLLRVIWDLVWSGRLTNDTLSPLRALGRSGMRMFASTPGPRSRSRHGARPSLPTRTGPPAGAGRWSLLPDPSNEPTRRAHALAERLLDRHGIVTRGSISAEETPGGFAAVYKVLKGFEEAGRCRRGYFIEGLGGAQFALSGAVDRLRSLERSESGGAIVLAATDPANPYGAALPWPEKADVGHRPGRKAGALVVLVDGKLVLYVEKGGRSLITFSDDKQILGPAAEAIATQVKEGALGKLGVERADGGGIADTILSEVLEAAGFKATPKGLRLRA
ncbi:MAG TPA: DEAD/DEAH box helicase [Actinomycetota bacterium]|nr:DEAD/DEAH box helicase [Actinomycetota bacterium]